MHTYIHTFTYNWYYLQALKLQQQILMWQVSLSNNTQSAMVTISLTNNTQFAMLTVSLTHDIPFVKVSPANQ